MRAACPATSAEAKEVPKFASSRMASTGPRLSLSRLLQTAIEMVFTALKNPVTSAATPTTRGAVRTVEQVRILIMLLPVEVREPLLHLVRSFVPDRREYHVVPVVDQELIDVVGLLRIGPVRQVLQEQVEVRRAERHHVQMNLVRSTGVPRAGAGAPG